MASTGETESEHRSVAVTVSRRDVVVGLGMLPLLRLLPRSTVEAAFAQKPDGYRFLDDHEARVVIEATARLIPGPLDDPEEAGHPGAREAGVVFYIDRMLSAFHDDPPRIFAGGPFSDRAGATDNELETFIPLTPEQEVQWRGRLEHLGATYRDGIGKLDAGAGGDFTAVTGDEQDAILVAETDFRRVLFEHAIEGTYALPEYGGNRELTGWGEIGYPGDSAPRGFTATEVSDSDGPDEAPADVPLPYAPASARGERPTAALLGEIEPPAEVDDLSGVIPDLGAFLDAALPGLGRRGSHRG